MKKNVLSARKCLQAVVPYQPGKPIEEVQRELGLKDVIKLASNENPLGPSAKAMRAAEKAVAAAAMYPDGSCYRLRHALAKFYDWNPEGIILGSGSNELLLLLGQAFLNPGDEVLTSQMSFAVYPAVAQLAEARFVATPMREFTFDLKALSKAVTDRTKIIFIANPNNPTGTMVSPTELEKFVRRVPASCLLVLDEAYYEYTDPLWRPDSLSWVLRQPNVAVLRTFSKAYGLAGMRVGYGLVSPEVAHAVERVRAPFNVNHIAQEAAMAALADSLHVKRSVALARREREWLTVHLGKYGFEAVPSQTNFVFANVPRGTGQTWFAELMKHGVIIRPMPGPYVRITLGTRDQNERLIEAIKAIQNSSFNV
jgi:histidinol-phosphate aminotransferase